MEAETVTIKHVVVYDPTGEWWEGALVDQQRAIALEGRGVVLLPVSAEQVRASGVGGWSKRSWGAGIPTTGSVPRMIAPLSLFVVPHLRRLSWVARLVRDTTVEMPESGPIGLLRIVSDTSQPMAQAASISSSERSNVDVSKLGEADENGGWFVRGDAAVHASQLGHAGLSVYGTALGLRLAWAAVSLS